MNKIFRLGLSSVFLLVFAFSAFAQETEITVIDEVVVQVNESVITLSQVNRAKQIAVRALVASGKKEEEATLEVEKKEGELIASLITEEIMMQKGKEIGLEKSVEAEVNRRLLDLAKRNNLQNLEQLYAEMKREGVDPEILKQDYRSKIMEGQVYSQMVDRTVYWGISDKELKEYFSKNKSKFAQRETAELSEIFLTFAGKNEEDVIALANSLVKRARNGEDFGDLAVKFSDRPNKKETRGLVGKFPVTELNDDIKNAIKGLKDGSIADPIRWDIGMEIVRVDSYTPASDDSNFDEDLVRQAILREKGPQARKDWIEKERRDSYIKIREKYRGAVSPFLTTQPTEVAKTTGATN